MNLHHPRSIIVVLLVAFALYLPGVVRNDFVTIDDTQLITSNPIAQGISAANLYDAFTTYDPELYVPLTIMSYQMDSAIGGLRPWIFHLTNLLLHCGSVLLCYVIARNMGVGDALAAIVAGIFALHPLNVEAVSWAAARKDVLSTFFALLSLHAWISFRSEHRRRSQIWSVVWFFLALLSKVSVILLPIAMLLMDSMRGVRLSRKSLPEYAPFATLMVIFSAVAIGGKTRQFQEVGIVETVLLGSKSLAFFVMKFFAPLNLSLYEPQLTPVSILAPDILGSIALVLIIAGSLWFLRKTHPMLVWGSVLSVLTIAPSFFNFWKHDTLYFATDRYGYIATFGLALGLAEIISHTKILERRFTPIFGVLIGTLVVGITAVNAQAWKDSESLFTRALRAHPDFAVAMNNLGASIYTKDPSRAVELYAQALERDQTLTSAYLNLGLHKAKQSDIGGAIATLSDGLRHIPADRPPLKEEVTLRGNLGSLLEQTGQVEAALDAFRATVARAPEDAHAHYNYGVMLQKYQRLPEAKAELMTYLRLKPRDIEARYRLAAIQAETGDLPGAKENLEMVLRADPLYERAQQHLTRIEELMGGKEL